MENKASFILFTSSELLLLKQDFSNILDVLKAPSQQWIAK